MRNYLREAIRQEVHQEIRQETRHDGQQGAPSQEPDAEFRVVLRPIASSLPLGFFAFTVGTVLLTALELRWVPVSETAEVAVLVLAFVVPLEALSGLFSFLARDSGAATGLTTAASVTGKPLFGLLLLTGACRFALTGVFQATGNTAVEQTAGWLGVPLALFALYGGLALLLEESTQRMVLPLGRRGRARTSLEGSFGHQARQAKQEAGVRRQL